MFGKLTWSAVPFHEPIIMVTSAVVALAITAVLAWVIVKGHLPYIWKEWLSSVDHKRIGVMYIVLALVMLLRGFADALLMRSQQAVALGSTGFLPPEHYNQIFSAHGTIMIFFVAMPFVIGLMNFAVPLQLGARDVAFPVLNSVSFWLTATGALLVNISLFIGEFARVGWLPYPPLAELTYSPGVGVDYYLWALQISGVGTLLTGVNFVTTVLKVRAPGMTYLHMPVFCWTTLASNLLIVAAFPILTATLAMLLLDRYLGFHFFTNEAGGNPMMFMNLIWAWGHPEVYILVLPAFGIFSEVFATFSGKPLFGYRSMVAATMAICVLSFMVWLHHFFTMGAGANVNAIFGIATMIIAVPTGVKIYNWLFTMYGGRVVFATPMLWALGFVVTFVIGGITGVLVAVPPADFVLHNSLFLVAHFHNVIIGGVVFGLFAGYTYWFPKAFGFRLHEGLGKAAFWCWFVGFYVAFMPLYVLGLMGMTRRMQHYDVPEWQPWLVVAAGGALLIGIGVAFQVVQLVWSIRHREALRDVTGDPWNGRTLEWMTPSPPPMFNYAVMPDVEGVEAYWMRKQSAIERQALRPEPEYHDIHMPRNSSAGFICAFFSTTMGFALIWHIWWLVAVAFVGAWAVFVVVAWRDEHEEAIPAATVASVDRANRAAREAVLRDAEAALVSAGAQAYPGGVAGGGRTLVGGHAQALTEEPAHGPSKRIVVAYGFWIFLISDIILFAALFASYAVLTDATAGGPSGRDLFDLPTVAVETGCLLLSTVFCGLAGIGAQARRNALYYGSMAMTFVLGATFVAIEVHEFATMIHEGAGPGRSAFLSAFFALIGCHGLHVSAGLLWLLTMMAQVYAKGYRPDIRRRLLCFALFWHTLDIIWVALFSLVYLVGVAPQ